MISLATITRCAEKSGHRNFRHVAVLIKGGAIVSIGWNHGLAHAERSAIQKLWPDHRAGLTLWSFRVTWGGRLAMAMPCLECQDLCRRNGIYRIRYTDSSGQVQKMRVLDMAAVHKQWTQNGVVVLTSDSTIHVGTFQILLNGCRICGVGPPPVCQADIEDLSADCARTYDLLEEIFFSPADFSTYISGNNHWTLHRFSAQGPPPLGGRGSAAP